MTATRTSSRQAAQKAKEAIAAAPDTKSRGGAGAKRKEAEEKEKEKGPVKKKGKKDEKAEPEPEKKEEEPAERESEPETKEEEEEKKKDETTAEGEEQAADKEPEAGGEEEKEVKGEEPEGQKEPAQKTSEAATADKEEEPEPAAKTEDKKQDQDEAQPTPSDQEKPGQKDDSPPTVLEKGIIYFFFRPRVNVTDTQSMDEVARSFIVLRPTPGTAALDQKEGPLEAGATCRLLMVPKKQFPKSTGQREMGFVEKAGKTVKEVEESLLSSETYATETRGEQVTPEAKPYAEGVYAITRTPNDSRLAYVVTIPAEMGPVQEEFGLEAQGGWIVQSKNPKYPGPPIAQPTQNPEYPPSVEEKFQDYRWIPLEPELIDYAHAQFLLIGHTHREPGSDLKQMEAENETRVEEHGQGDQTIYQDLGVHAKEYPAVPTTWGH